jgi:hypothetical protein
LGWRAVGWTLIAAPEGSLVPLQLHAPHKPIDVVGPLRRFLGGAMHTPARSDLLERVGATPGTPTSDFVTCVTHSGHIVVWRVAGLACKPRGTPLVSLWAAHALKDRVPSTPSNVGWCLSIGEVLPAAGASQWAPASPERLMSFYSGGGGGVRHAVLRLQPVHEESEGEEEKKDDEATDPPVRGMCWCSVDSHCRSM